MMEAASASEMVASIHRIFPKKCLICNTCNYGRKKEIMTLAPTT
jgi:hypothetical protein